MRRSTSELKRQVFNAEVAAKKGADAKDIAEEALARMHEKDNANKIASIRPATAPNGGRRAGVSSRSSSPAIGSRRITAIKSEVGITSDKDNTDNNNMSAKMLQSELDASIDEVMRLTELLTQRDATIEELQNRLRQANGATVHDESTTRQDELRTRDLQRRQIEQVHIYP
jgi:hypothetical protein